MKNTRFFLAAAAMSAGLTFHPVTHAQSYNVPELATSIEPVHITKTRTECQQASSGVPNWLGKSLGAVLGAVAGSTVGKGSGNTIATASGAVIGSQAGEAMSGTGGQPQQTCREVIERTLTGYDIKGNGAARIFAPVELIQSVR